MDFSSVNPRKGPRDEQGYVTLKPYEPLRALDSGIHVMDGQWRRSPLRRRMTVLQGAAGKLALHSAIEIDPTDLDSLDRLGEVALILVPNRFHATDASFYARRYPQAKLLVPAQLEAEMCKKLFRVDGRIEDGLAWGTELLAYPLAGTRMGEVLFHHPESRTLIVTDLLFHYRREDFGGIARILMQLNGALDHFGPTRLFKRFFVTDRSAFVESMRPVLDLEIERVVMSHGEIIECDGQQRMQAAFAEF